MTSQGDPDLTSFEKAATEFAGILLLLGFEVTETIRMADGGEKGAALGRKALLDQARSAGSAL